jgi:hypothetical protein
MKPIFQYSKTKCIEIKKVKRWGRKDKQNELVRFCNRNNDSFNRTNEHETLINDNAPNLEPAVYPDIPAEMPGVVLESNVPAVETSPPQSDRKGWRRQ